MSVVEARESINRESLPPSSFCLKIKEPKNMHAGFGQMIRAALAAVVFAASGVFAGTTLNVPSGYADLAAALAAAQDGDEIVLAAGTYETAAEIILSNGITIRGATGKPEDVIVKATGTHRVFKLDNAEAKVSGLTIRDGNAGGESGGGAYITANGGTLENCVVHSCKNTGWGVPGGGVYVAKNAEFGLVDCCVVSNCACGNRQGGGGGVALALYGGVARSSLFVENRHSDNSGGNQSLCGTVKVSGGKLVNCTVANNHSYTCPGVWGESGLVFNCIIAENGSEKSTDVGYVTWAGSADCFSNCVSAVAINESCYAMAHPLHDAANGDYAPILGSVGVDHGLAEDWMAGAKDLKGNSRVSGSAPDAGAIEYDQTVFSAAFAASPSFGVAPLDVTFTVTTAGGTGPYRCSWDWDGDGTVDDTSTGTTTHQFASASHNNVKLTVKDEGSDATVVVPLPVPVKAFGESIHVVKGNANAAPPYDTWDNAAATVETAYDYAEDGTTILVAEGTHEIAAEIKVLKAVTIRGATGRAEDVILKATGTHRMFWLANAQAKLSCVTIRGGNAGALNGGGVYIDVAGGTLERCVVTDCKTTGWGCAGGGVYMAADSSGLVDGCVIYGCTTHTQGQGGGFAAALYGGVMRNSIVSNVVCTSKDGGDNVVGTVKVSGGELVNCTIAKNTSTRCPGVWAEKGRVVNCIIAKNTCSLSSDDKASCWTGDESCFDHCIGTDAMNDTCMKSEDPFADSAHGDLSVLLGSDAIDYGVEEAWMADATDFAGNARLSGKAPDVGAYEYDQSQFSAGFTADVASGIAPLTVTFTVTPSGAMGAVRCSWDWDGDGTVDEIRDDLVATHEFKEATSANVKLSVTDLGSGTTFDVPLPVKINALSKYIYVRKECENPVSPYVGWATAAKTVEDALAAAVEGCEIVISNGTHTIGAQMMVTKDITFRGVTGRAEDVILKSSGAHRVFWLDNAAAKVADLTVCGATGGDEGAGIYIGDKGGTVFRCVIRDCKTSAWGVSGGGIYIAAGAADGLVDSCVISNCCAHREGNGGGHAISLYGGVARNCLITKNVDSGANPNNNSIGSVKVAGGELVNCTVTKNASAKCPGVWASSGKVVNCIIAENTCEASTDRKANSWAGDENCFVNCVGTDAMNGSCTRLEHPFADAARGDYTPILGTAAVDGGVEEDWMAEAKDLLGNARVSGNAPDVGAIEYDQSKLAVGYTVDVASGKAPLMVTFTVTAIGATGDVTCHWDLDGDGVAETTSDKLTFTHTYEQPCAATVGLSIIDAGSGQTCDAAVKTTVRALGDAIHVSGTSAHPAEPYDTWENAAHSVEDALAIAIGGSEVIVSNGVYDIAVEQQLLQDVTVRGLTGKFADTVLRSKKNSGNHRIFWLDCADARVEGLTVCNASMNDHGAGVYIGAKGGVLSHCMVSNCSCIAANGKSGGGVYIEPGADTALVDACVISACKSHHENGAGGAAISVAAGLVWNCLITGNDMNNVSGNPKDCGSVRVVGGVVANCTVAGNRSKTCPGIVANYDAKTPNPGRVVNCAIGDNTTQNTDGTYNTSWAGDPNCFDHCIGPEQINASCFAGEGLFVDAANGDYRLPKDSVALDKGVRHGWMLPGGKDFFGGHRVCNGRPDLGYFELQVNGTLFILR